MFSKSLLALVFASSAAIGHVHAGGASVAPPVFVPNGTFQGAWISGSLTAPGILSGHLRDASGQPLWTLQCTLDAHGMASGELDPLFYPTQPILGFGKLAAIGSVQVSPDGNGSFDLQILSASTGVDGTKPIAMIGRIVGTLVNGRASSRGSGLDAMAADTQASGAHGAASAGAAGLGDKIVCPKGRHRQAAGVSGASGAHGANVAPGLGTVDVGEVIVCPKGGDLALLGVKAAGLGGGFANHGVKHGGSASASAAAALSGRTLTGARSAGDPTLPDKGSGPAHGHWVLSL